MSGADRPTIDQPYELIETSRRYVLGEAPDGYGIWDSLAGNELVERFPLTEDGLDIAMKRFVELKRRDRRDRWNPFRVALIATVAGASLWLLAGLATLPFSFGTQVVGAELLFVLDVLGFRLAVGSLLVLAVLLLLQRLPGAQDRLPSAPGFLEEPPSRGWDLVLRTVLVGGLTAWTLSAIATEALFRQEFGPLGPNPSGPAIAAQLASTLSFRTWVAALIVLVLRRLHSRAAAPTGARER